MKRPLLALIVLLAPVAASIGTRAQDRPTVFIHGINSSSATWEMTADRLQADLQIAANRPSLSHLETFSSQASQLANLLGAQPATTIALGHSNGGLVARQWNRSGQPLSAVITIGTPHRGLPLVNNIGGYATFNFELAQSFANLEGAIIDETNLCHWWEAEEYCDVAPYVWSIIENTVDLGELLSQASFGEIISAFLLNLTAPVITDMAVGSQFFAGLNSQENVNREAAEIPLRLGIMSTARNYKWGGPIRAIWPYQGDLYAGWRDLAVNVMRYYAYYIMAAIPNPSLDQQAVAGALLWVANYLEVMDDWWCWTVSAAPMQIGLCWENDTIVPLWTQDYHALGAEWIWIPDGYPGPAHTQETHPFFSAEALTLALVSYANVEPRPGGPPPAMLVALQASNGQYVVAEGGGGGAVNADRSNIGAWETFTLSDLNGGTLEDGDPVAFRTDSGNFLQAVDGGCVICAMLAIGIGPFQNETFTIVGLDHPGGQVEAGDAIALRSQNGYYVVAEGGGGGVVNVNRQAIGGWETFRLIIQ